jgi:hypothetical protein
MLLGKHPAGLSGGIALERLSFTISYKALQRRLTALVDEDRAIVGSYRGCGINGCCEAMMKVFEPLKPTYLSKR